MYVKTDRTGTSYLATEVVVDEGGDEEPPTTERYEAEFNDEGVARVSEDAGEALVDAYDAVSVHRRETENEDED